MLVEIWRTLLFPNQVRYTGPDLTGLGGQRPKMYLPNFFKCMLHFMATVRGTERLPLRWLCVLTYPLDKRNRKELCKGIRLLNGYDSLGNACTWALWRQHTHKFDDTCHGFIQHRRWETAIVVRLWRLSAAGLPYVTTLHDVTNAFESTAHNTLSNLMNNELDPATAALLSQRHRASVVFIRTPDGVLSVMPHCGGRQGCRINLFWRIRSELMCGVDGQLRAAGAF